MRTILLVAMLAACGGDDGGSDPHEVVDCTPGIWGSTTMCERACAAGPSGTGIDADMNGTDDTCRTDVNKLGFTDCRAADIVVFDHMRGCCPPEPVRAFYECKPL